MLVHQRVSHSIKFAGTGLTLGLREALWEWGVLLKNTVTQGPWPGLEPRPLDPELSTLTIWDHHATTLKLGSSYLHPKCECNWQANVHCITTLYLHMTMYKACFSLKVEPSYSTWRAWQETWHPTVNNMGSINDIAQLSEMHLDLHMHSFPNTFVPIMLRKNKIPHL